VPCKHKSAKFDLSLFISEKKEQLNCLWEYKTDLFNVDTIERMSGHFQTLVAAIISNSQQKISLQAPTYQTWERAFVAPRTPREKIVKEIWSEVLGMEQIGIDDNFFELGGNSVMVTQVLSRIEAKFSVQLPIRSFFESQTVESLAIAILENQTAKIDEQELIALLERLENED
jgi:acyl carrier protein